MPISSPKMTTMLGFFSCACARKTIPTIMRNANLRANVPTRRVLCIFDLRRGKSNSPCVDEEFLLSPWSHGEDGLPVFLHVHNDPSFFVRLIQGFVQLADVRSAVIGVLAFGICVMDNQHEAGLASCSPLEHLLISVGISESGDRGPANDLAYSHRFPGTV